MKVSVKNVGSNMIELEMNGIKVLYSYETPVAGFDSAGAFRTDTKYSVTTSKHINKYLGGRDVGRIVTQQFINDSVHKKDSISNSLGGNLNWRETA